MEAEETIVCCTACTSSPRPSVPAATVDVCQDCACLIWVAPSTRAALPTMLAPRLCCLGCVTKRAAGEEEIRVLPPTQEQLDEIVQGIEGDDEALFGTAFLTGTVGSFGFDRPLTLENMLEAQKQMREPEDPGAVLLTPSQWEHFKQLLPKQSGATCSALSAVLGVPVHELHGGRILIGDVEKYIERLAEAGAAAERRRLGGAHG